jgi:hypothetical protein
MPWTTGSSGALEEVTLKMGRLAELATLGIRIRAEIVYVCASPLTPVQHADTGGLEFPEQSRREDFERGPAKIISWLKEQASGTRMITERMKIKAPRRKSSAGCSRRDRQLGSSEYH